MHSFDKRMAKMLVEMDILVGLLSEVEILCHERLFLRRLDYLNIPFRCSRCREVGHLQRECPVLCQGATSPCTHPSPLLRQSSPPPLGVVTNCSPSLARASPTKGNYTNACSFFDDVLEQELLLDSVVSSGSLPSSAGASVPLGSLPSLVSDPSLGSKGVL